MIHLESPEDIQQYELLASPPGTIGSGAIRYAAAMYFYKRGFIGGEILEVYRACCKKDSEDPITTLALMGLSLEADTRENR